ncbi:50S ribosomal protein L14e [Candidatus Bathyarchaeota archaeon]|nr:50S ribosomal protein L14e [Candidatus Bathyarchaeota archaeon]MBS7631090.1 50S ribosomal protein L14e [Candidatus Bathyarchaeota archaeon]
MSAIEIGRVCVKTKGREAGKRCVVVDIIDKNFVIASGPKELTGIKRRRVNINHLEPTEEKINIKRNTTDEEIRELLEKEEKKT